MRVRVRVRVRGIARDRAGGRGGRGGRGGEGRGGEGREGEGRGGEGRGGDGRGSEGARERARAHARIARRLHSVPRRRRVEQEAPPPTLASNAAASYLAVAIVKHVLGEKTQCLDLKGRMMRKGEINETGEMRK